MITGGTVFAIVSRVARVTDATDGSVVVIANTVGIASQGGGGAIGATDLIVVIVLIAVDALTNALGVTELIGTGTGVGVTGVIGTGVAGSVYVITIAFVANLAVGSNIALLTSANHDTGAIIASATIGTRGFQARTIGNAQCVFDMVAAGTPITGLADIAQVAFTHGLAAGVGAVAMARTVQLSCLTIC